MWKEWKKQKEAGFGPLKKQFYLDLTFQPEAKNFLNLNFGSVLMSLSAGMSLSTDLKALWRAFALSGLWKPTCHCGVMNLLHSWFTKGGQIFFYFFNIVFFYFFLKWANHGLILFIFVLFQTRISKEKTVVVCGIRTRIVWVEGEHADHLVGQISRGTNIIGTDYRANWCPFLYAN